MYISDLGFFLRLDPVGNDVRSVTKSESTFYLITLLSRLFQQIVTPLLKIYVLILFNLQSFIFIFAFTEI